MKRSQMVKIIRDEIWAATSELSRIGQEELAERILQVVEQKGMLPPAIETNIWNRQDCCYYEKNEWEKED